jgi:hypothetical protein
MICALTAASNVRAADGLRYFESEGELAAALVKQLAPRRVVAFGEYHETTAGPRARSALSHFAEEFLPALRGKAHSIVIETWITDGRCGETEKQAVAKVEAAIERPQKTENEILALVEKARAAGMKPAILKLSCEEYLKIYPPGGEVDALALLGTVTAQLVKEIEAALTLTKKGPVLVNGGALHNDLRPPRELQQFTFGERFRKKLSYAEVDLYVPEIVEKDASVTSEKWFARWKAESRGRPALIARAPDSFVVMFAPTTAPR